MAPATGSFPYPGFSNPYLRGKLPPVNKRTKETMCAGRVMIFLILGALLFVLGLVSLGIYLNITSLTSSREHTEIMPLFITSGTILLSGICVCLLFWKRLKTLVFFTVVVTVATGFLCGITAVLTTTHVLKPLQTFRLCRYYVSQKLCLCYSPYKRDLLELQFSETEDTKYDFTDVSSCTDVEDKLPQLLVILVSVYGLVFLLCIGSAILSLLSLRAEVKQRFLGNESYDEVYTVSGNSSQEQSDSEAEIGVEVTTLPDPLVTPKPISTPKIPVGVLKHKYPSNSSQSDLLQGSSTQITGSLLSKTSQGQRSRTPGTNDLGKESLANRYKINKTPDRDVTVRQRLSKTPDREIGACRRYSFSGSKRLSKSCDSLESSGNENKENDKHFGTDPLSPRKKGRLKEHRRKGKRAATVHTLDTDQLLLILNLQMRYLQETSEQQNNENINHVPGSRRAVTPQPVSHKTLIPQKIRSHTPQPRRANRVARDQGEGQFYSQGHVRHSSLSQGVSSENSSRRTSESSDKNFDFIHNKQYISKNQFAETSGSYLHSQQIKKFSKNSAEPYNPYIHTQGGNRPEGGNFVTYSDSMLSSNSKKPKSRSSTQDNCLPSRPIHRGSHNQLPPQPISRQRNVDRQLPRQPVHRGTSAFHVVDRSSKSRSPSVASDKMVGSRESLAKHKSSQDYAEYAIRDNFSMNQKQFILTDNRRPDYNQNMKKNQHNTNQVMNGNLMKGGTSVPVESLPPYSGPPSYREYVSSCNTSVTSSLSSNPDDMYSMPKRKVKPEQDKSESGGTIFSVVSQRVENSSKNGVGIQDNNIYGNAEIINDSLVGAHQRRNPQINFDGRVGVQGQNYNMGQVYNVNMGQGYPSNMIQGQGYNQNMSQGQGQSLNLEQGQPSSIGQGHMSQEVIYSSPSRSKVKQCIVPEDYYASVCNVRRQEIPYGTSIDILPNSGIMGSILRQNEHGGNQGMYNMSRPQDIVGQIAPDAKYNVYEDVYDSADSVQVSLPQSSSGNYTVNTHGISCVNETPCLISPVNRDVVGNVKQTQKSKSNVPVSNVHANLNFKHDTNGCYGNPTQAGDSVGNANVPVSNVHANLNFKHDTNGCYGNPTQAGDNVGNVHASNLTRIPCIKLNDQDVEQADDDVFLDNSNNSITKETALHSSVNYPKNCPDVIQVQIDQNQGQKFVQNRKNDYEEINDLEITNQNPYSGHVTELTNETAEGYMKMTLPGKEPQNQIFSEPTNQIASSDHVTCVSANQKRPKPDGIDTNSEEDKESYAETGV